MEPPVHESFDVPETKVYNADIFLANAPQQQTAPLKKQTKP